MRSKADPVAGRRSPGRDVGLGAMVAVLAITGLTGCARLLPRVEPTTCTPDFSVNESWLGGDAVYSVSLPDRSPGERRTVWLFGDTYVADPSKPPPTNRVGAYLVHNSIALSSCRASGFEIHYAWGHDSSGTPQAFIETGATEDIWYWLFDGFVYRGALYLGLLEVAPAAPEGPLGMPFALVGMSLARIDDPDAPPGTWRPRIMSLSASRAAFPGAAMRIQGDHVLLYAFANRSADSQPRFLSRLPLAALDADPDDLEPWLETWTRNGDWQAGFLPTRAAILMPDNATEMSVEPHRDRDGATHLLAIYGAPLQTDAAGDTPAVRSNAIHARRAETATGPWSDRVLVHAMDEARDLEGGTICYAAKEHPAFARAGELLITYVCNAIATAGQDPLDPLRRLERDMGIYVPRVIRVPVPEKFAPTSSERSDPPAH